MKKIIGIIGFGNMGSAIGQRIRTCYQVIVFDKDRSKTENISGIQAALDNIDLVKTADAVILAVKPQDFKTLLAEIKEHIKDKLVISIAAGITTAYIERQLGKARVVRVMPNLPARVGKGMICLCKGKTTHEKDLNFTQQLFGNLGKTLVLDENLMDQATAISGSGPGYNYYLNENKSIEEIKKYTEEVFIPSLTASAKKLGFTPQQAKILAETTGGGSIAFLEETKISPTDAKKQVASKGGTTQAGIEVLKKRGSLLEAVKAALRRARELSK